MSTSFNNILIVVLLLFAGQSIQAQTFLMKRDVGKQLSRLSSGPNQKHTWMNVYGTGIPLPFGESDSLETAKKSNIFYMGGQYRYQVSQVLSLGCGLQWTRIAIHVAQDSVTNLLSLGIENTLQKFVRNSLDLEPSIRINIGPRGNTIGDYIELAGYGGFMFSDGFIAKNDVEAKDFSGAEEVKIVSRKLRYMNKLDYGAIFRVGFGTFNVWARYRLSDNFKANEYINGGRVLPEMARLTIGIGATLWTPGPEYQ
jgi:hypothetical protein